MGVSANYFIKSLWTSVSWYLLIKVVEVLCTHYFTAPGPLCLLSIHLWSSLISTATKQITHYFPSSIYALSILRVLLFCSFHLLNLWLSQLSQMQDIWKLTSKNVNKAQLCIIANYILFGLRRKGIWSWSVLLLGFSVFFINIHLCVTPYIFFRIVRKEQNNWIHTLN